MSARTTRSSIAPRSPVAVLRSRLRWPRNDVLALGILLATIAAIVVPLVVVGSDNTARAEPKLVMRSIRVTHSAVEVSGIATGVPSGYVVYAMARARGAQQGWVGAIATPSRPSGAFSASIAINPPTLADYSISLVQYPEEATASAVAGESKGGGGEQAESAPEESARATAQPGSSASAPAAPLQSQAGSGLPAALAEDGPHARGVFRSSTATAQSGRG